MRGASAGLAAAIGTAALALAATAALAGDNYATERKAITLSPAQTQFILRCGGCHGTLGESPQKSVPTLRRSVGYFLCTPEGRDYIARLPNVSRSPLTDQQLTDVINWVAFELGEHSAPAGAVRYTVEEIAAARARPLHAPALNDYRRGIVTKLVKSCGAPRAMLEYGRPRKL